MCLFYSVDLQFSTDLGQTWHSLSTPCLHGSCHGNHQPVSSTFSSDDYPRQGNLSQGGGGGYGDACYGEGICPIDFQGYRLNSRSSKGFWNFFKVNKRQTTLQKDVLICGAHVSTLQYYVVHYSSELLVHYQVHTQCTSSAHISAHQVHLWMHIKCTVCTSSSLCTHIKCTRVRTLICACLYLLKLCNNKETNVMYFVLPSWKRVTMPVPYVAMVPHVRFQWRQRWDGSAPNWAIDSGEMLEQKQFLNLHIFIHPHQCLGVKSQILTSVLDKSPWQPVHFRYLNSPY